MTRSTYANSGQKVMMDKMHNQEKIYKNKLNNTHLQNRWKEQGETGKNFTGEARLLAEIQKLLANLASLVQLVT